VAPSIRGSGSNGSAGTGNLVVTSSAAPVAGDHIYLVININNASSGTHPTPASTGFTSLGSSTASVWSRTTLLGKIASGSEGTSFTLSGFTGADAKSASVIVVQSADSALPTNIVTTPDASSNTTWSIPVITTAAADSLDMAIVGFGGNASPSNGTANFSAWGTSLTELIDFAFDTGGSNFFSGLGVATAPRVSSGSQAATSVTSTITDVSAAIRVEIKAAVAATKALPPQRRPYRFFGGTIR
jgi:hypothetical protein